ncbi:MAG TPA: prepilin-type N-terminal cleavage/methylation domain-containing protein [Gemmatimonadaceae bacterium]|nr:prepilin-type N-terminal cleavage/methylation domain-containing protein [Gemmatimonadaceae bacterium]
MLRNTRKGFTLIELLIVVVIIGILAAIAIPKFAATKDKAKLASVKTDVRNLMSIMEGKASDNGGVYPTTLATTDYTLSAGNALGASGIAGTASGYSIELTNSSISTDPKSCGVFVGSGTAPNAAVTKEGVIACW